MTVVLCEIVAPRADRGAHRFGFVRGLAQTLLHLFEQTHDIVALGIPHLAGFVEARLHIVRRTFGSADIARGGQDSYYGVWLCEYLNHLSEHLTDLVGPAMAVAELRRRSWWR